MLAKERIYRICEIINTKGFISVNELIQQLNSSRSSIIRDLIQLENQGLIIRERGGASSIDSMAVLSSFNETSVMDKENIKLEEKIKVCQEAAKLIHDGDCIFIDSGTTPVSLIPFITSKKITIVTASLHFIKKIPVNFSSDIYLIGGLFNRKYDISSGDITLEMIKQFNFDHSFLSTSGINLKTGELYASEISIGAIKKEVVKRSKHNYLLADDSKYSIKALCTWGHTKSFKKIFVNEASTPIPLPSNYQICK